MYIPLEFGPTDLTISADIFAWHKPTYLIRLRTLRVSSKTLCEVALQLLVGSGAGSSSSSAMAARSPRLLAPGAYMMIVVTIIASVHGNVHLANEPNNATEQTRIDTLPGKSTDTAARHGSSTAPALPVVHVQTKGTVHPVHPITKPHLPKDTP